MCHVTTVWSQTLKLKLQEKERKKWRSFTQHNCLIINIKVEVAKKQKEKSDVHLLNTKVPKAIILPQLSQGISGKGQSSTKRNLTHTHTHTNSSAIKGYWLSIHTTGNESTVYIFRCWALPSTHCVHLFTSCCCLFCFKTWSDTDSKHVGD